MGVHYTWQNMVVSLPLLSTPPKRRNTAEIKTISKHKSYISFLHLSYQCVFKVFCLFVCLFCFHFLKKNSKFLDGRLMWRPVSSGSLQYSHSCLPFVLRTHIALSQLGSLARVPSAEKTPYPLHCLVNSTYMSNWSPRITSWGYLP